MLTSFMLLAGLSDNVAAHKSSGSNVTFDNVAAWTYTSFVVGNDSTCCNSSIFKSASFSRY